MDRRKFHQAASATVASAALCRPTTASVENPEEIVSPAQINRPNARQKIRLAQIGAGGQGSSLAKRFHRQKGVEVVYVCDPDEARRNRAAKALGEGPRPIQDFRQALDDRSIDAVFVATPDHWHVPASLLALDAGKHVYVEKPCSHNVSEGRMLVDMARKKKALVQHGTHSRSIPLLANAIEALRENVIGEVKVAKAWNVQKRGQIGKAQPSDPPAGFDYDLWVGPAEMVPFQTNRHHYNWHWWYNFGTGDTGNDGVHELDIARWGLGVHQHPEQAGAIGGKLSFDDDQQFPDTQFANFSYPEQQKQLNFEMRLWSRYGMHAIDNGNAFYGEGGWMLLSKRGIRKLHDERGKEREFKWPDLEPVEHTVNFVQALRGEARLAAPIEEGHLSSTLCHLANVSTRLGRMLRFDPKSEQVSGDAEAQQMMSRTYRDHWAKPESA
ncbi:MAG: Gfo/Idh/MocA family oxidoreductase [Planctomycetota bacterium]|nr:Gfo/Idh/MocA family oxidoreductase [Planctomycetota bacterium]